MHIDTEKPIIFSLAQFCADFWRKVMANEAGLMLVFAEKYELKPNEAMMLPALFAVAAKKTGINKDELIAQAECNEELGNYLAEMAKKVGGTKAAKEEYEKFLEEKIA